MTDAVGSVMAVVSNVMSTIEGNTLLMCFMTAPLIGIAVSIVRKLVGRY